MYKTNCKRKYKAVSFIMALIFSISTVFQFMPSVYFSAQADEASDFYFSWIDNNSENEYIISENGKNATWNIENETQIIMTAKIIAGINETAENISLTVPKYAYNSNEEEFSPVLDISALEASFEALYDENSKNFVLVPKQTLSGNVLNVDLNYVGSAPNDNKEFDINAMLAIDDDIQQSCVHGIINLVSQSSSFDDLKSDSDLYQAYVNEYIDSEEEESSLISPVSMAKSNMIKAAENPTNIIWQWMESDEGERSDNNKTQSWDFSNTRTFNLKAALYINTNKGNKFKITVPRYAYTYRNSDSGPELSVDKLEEEFDVKLSEDGKSYILDLKEAINLTTGSALTKDITLTYENASVVKTENGTNFDIDIKCDIYNDDSLTETKTDKITGEINTKIVRITDLKKQAKGKITDNGQIESWSGKLYNTYGITEEDFNNAKAEAEKDGKVVYFSEFLISAKIEGCQPYTVSLSDLPKNGEVLAVTNDYDNLKTSLAKKGNEYVVEFEHKYNEDNADYLESPAIYILVKYTLSNQNEKLENTAKITAEEIDKPNRSVEGSKAIKYQWADVSSDYDDGVWGIQKGFYRTNLNGAINLLSAGGNKQFRYQVTGIANTSNYLNTLELLNNYNNGNYDVKPAYRAEVIDDAVYAQLDEGEYVQLDNTDYEFTSCRVYISAADMTGGYIDNKKKPGEIIPNVGEFQDLITSSGLTRGALKLYVMDKNSPDSWKEWSGEPTLKSSKDSDNKIRYYYEYTFSNEVYRVKASYEETQLAQNRIQLNLYGKYKGSGNHFKDERLIGKNVQSFAIINWSAIHGYQNTNSTFIKSNKRFGGLNSWQNPADESCINKDATKAEILDLDKKLYGSGECYNSGEVGYVITNGGGWSDDKRQMYSQRAGTSHNVYRTPVYAGAAKWHDPINGIDNKNAADGKISYNLIAMYGTMSGFSEDLTEMMRTDVMTETKKVVFYDLLPKGLKYDSVAPFTGNQTVDTDKNGTYTWELNDITTDGYSFVPEDEAGEKNIQNLKKYKTASAKVKDDNYKGSGRQLVEITVEYDAPPVSSFINGNNAQLYSLFFSVKLNTVIDTPVKDGEAIKFNRADYHNYVAAQFFDKNNKPIEIDSNSVSPDDGNYFKNLKGSDGSQIFADIDNDKSNDSLKTVVYADAISKGSDEGDSAVVSKLIKAIEYDDQFKTSTYTDLGGEYQYRLQYNLYKGISSDVAIYTALENAPGYNERWYGNVKSIDVSEAAKQLGLSGNQKIRVFYNPDKLQHSDIQTSGSFAGLTPESILANGSGWTELSLDSDYVWNNSENTEIGTVAIYFEGVEFVASNDSKNQANVYINMTATEDYDKRNEKAYSDVAYYNRLEGTGIASAQVGNEVEIGVKTREYSFNIKKNFVDKDGKTPKTYFGNVSFKIEPTKYPESKKPELIANNKTVVINDDGSANVNLNFLGQTELEASKYVTARFTKPGTYEFKVTEVDLDNDYVTYSKEEYTVKVVVTFNGSVTPTYYGRTVNITKGTSDYDENLPMSFTNTVEKEPEELILPTPILFVKKFTGNITEDGGKQFLVKVTCDENSIGTLYRIAGTQITTSNNYSLTIPKGNYSEEYTRSNSVASAKYTQAGIYTYTVEEVCSGTDSYKYDQSVYKVSIEILNNDGKLEKGKTVITKIRNSDGIDLETPEEVYNSLTDTQYTDKNPYYIPFENTNEDTYKGIEKHTPLTLKKILLDSNSSIDSKNKDFKYTFKITPDDFSKGTVVNTSYSLNYGRSDTTVSVSGNEISYERSNAPVFKYSKPGIYRYTITETPDTITASVLGNKVMTYDSSEYLVVIKVTADEAGNLTADTPIITKVVDANGDKLETSMRVSGKTVEFTNTLAVAELAPPIIKKSVKTLRSDDEYNQNIDNKEYGFRMIRRSGSSNIENGTQTIYINTDGESTAEGKFDNVIFWEAGTYTFEIAEVERTSETYAVNDNRKYTWTVTIEQKDGKYEVTKNEITMISGDGESKYDSASNSVTFENKYINNGTFEPKVSKELLGEALTDDEKELTEFTFRIEATDESAKNTPLPEHEEITVKAGETASFGVINFTKEGYYRYYISEVKPENAGSHLSYAARQLLYVNTEKGEDGIIRVTRFSYFKDGTLTTSDEKTHTFKFENEWHKKESRTLEIPVTKNRIGDKIPNSVQRVEFEISAITESAPMPQENTVTLTFRNGSTYVQSSSFDPIVFDTSENAEYHYQIKEVKGDYDCIYDQTVYDVYVTVSHGCVDKVVYKVNDEIKDNVEFTNIYAEPVILPETGGIGTNIFFELGGLLIMVGISWLIIKKTRSCDMQ